MEKNFTVCKKDFQYVKNNFQYTKKITVRKIFFLQYVKYLQYTNTFYSIQNETAVYGFTAY